MLKMYLVSVIIYMIVLKATEKMGKFIIDNRKDVNYKEYLKGDVKGDLSIFTISLIPIVRLFALGVALYIIFADKEHLDKLFKKEKTNE